MTPNCIDVSTWQRNIDWNRVKAAGIQAVIIRAGFGQTKDNQFENHYKGAKAAGLYIGAYWYSYAYSVDQAEQEARACIDILRGKTFDLPVYYDMEEDDQMALGRTTMTAMACRFIDTMQAAGYRGGMYSSPSWFSDFIDYDLMRRREYSIWLAHWASQPARACDIWQYGENGSIDGIDGDVDVDIIQNWDILDGDIPTPQPEPFTTELTVTAPILRRGDTGKAVFVLQALLLAAGYGAGGVDGIFGSGTESAVRSFQYQNALEVDGIAGKMTFGALCR
jgi:GH25 family lysozyme M1 (1,4-beta-N-acetylmuramidase)